jgi:hypothetical protein
VLEALLRLNLRGLAGYVRGAHRRGLWPHLLSQNSVAMGGQSLPAVDPAGPGLTY